MEFYFPAETFRVLKEKEEHGEYPTMGWVLDTWDNMESMHKSSVMRPTLLYFCLACHAALDAASSICFSGFLLPQE